MNEQLILTSVAAQEEAESARSAQLEAEQAKADLLDDAEARERLIGVIGHDLRNPLNTIALASGLLADNPNVEARDLGLRISRSATRMQSMLTEILDFTRVRLGGGFPLTFARMDVASTCRQIASELERGEGRVEVRVRGDVFGEWDAVLLGEMISNIAGNAVEHAMPATTVYIDLNGERDVVEIAITNMGPNIPADVIPTLFTPFRRADPSSRPREHLGLGLYIVDEIVRAHHGTIVVHSADGATRFTVRLPRTPAT